MKNVVLLTALFILTISSEVLGTVQDGPWWEPNLKIYLYSRVEKYGTLVNLSDVESLTSADFDNSRDTVFLIASWNHNYLADVYVYMMKAYLEVTDINVFIVDWSELTSTFQSGQSWVPKIGKLLGNRINILVEEAGLDLDKTSFVGFALGAHLAGVAGRTIGSKAHHIVGLDPAAPFFYNYDSTNRIDFTSAKYVQIVHTNANDAGMGDQLGHADFWPNGGKKQNGCTFQPRDCDQERAYWFFIESIQTGNFTAKYCQDYSTYVQYDCENNTSSWMGGVDVDTSVGGNFYLRTNASPPYAKGGDID